MLRGGYRFGFIKNADGTYQVDFAEGSSAANAQTLYNDIGYRVGIGFKNSSADFIFVEEDITRDILRRLIAYLDYDSYVNLDGERSSFMFDDGEVIKHWHARQIKDCFFLMKKRTNTVDITGWGLVVRDVGLNIRSAPTSAATKLGTVPIGGELKIKSFIPGFRSDGYQWG